MEMEMTADKKRNRKAAAGSGNRKKAKKSKGNTTKNIGNGNANEIPNIPQLKNNKNEKKGWDGERTRQWVLPRDGESSKEAVARRVDLLETFLESPEEMIDEILMDGDDDDDDNKNAGDDDEDNKKKIEKIEPKTFD